MEQCVPDDHLDAASVGFLGTTVHGYWERPKSTKVSRGKADDKCIYLVTIPHGRVVYRDKALLNHIGKTVDFYCDEGYKLVGKSSAECRSWDHEWSNTPPVCIKFQCSHLKGLQYGSITEYNNLPGGRVSFQCEEGYRMVGRSTIYCNPQNAEWDDPPPICQEDKCSPIVTFPNGQVLNYDNERGSTVEFVCDSDFALDGPNKATCGGSAPSWSIPVPSCKCKNPEGCAGPEAKCPNLVSIPNGFVTVTKEPAVYNGGRVRIECKKGWILKMPDGDITMYTRTVRCQPDGTWDQPIEDIQCIERRCEKREIMPGGYIVNATQNYPGGTIKVRCYRGYKVRGGRTAVHCRLDGTWSDDTYCYVPECENLLTFPNGYVQKYSNRNSYSNGTRSKFYCDEGYTLVGKKSNRCSLRERWDNAFPKCVFGFATCVAHGDPHYRTFDQQKINFLSGNCKYTLASTCGQAEPQGLEEFNVEAKNYPGVDQNQKSVSYTEYVTVDIAGHRIKLGPKKEVVIGTLKKYGEYSTMIDAEVRNLPVMGLPDMPGLTIKISGRFLEMRTDQGFSVRIDEYSKADITVPAEYANIGLCGICGNFDMMPSNDLVTKEGESVVTSIYKPKKDKYVWKYDWLKLGNSYEVNGPESPEGCRAKTQPKEECETEEKEEQVETSCGMMIDQHGMFKDCITKVGINSIKESYLSCKTDACLEDNIEGAVCQALADLADLCTQNDVKMQWRNKTFCPLPCGENQEYFPLTTACPETCNSIKENAGTCPDEPQEGCACKPGYVLSNAKCIPKSECGCTDENNRYFPVGEKYVNGDCTATMVCQEDGKFGSEPLPPCHEKASCGYTDGKRGCRCNDGYEGDGVTECKPVVGPATCICAGDPFYQTFDQAKMEFHGNEEYILVQNCGEGAPWRVTVKNAKASDGERTYAHSLKIELNSHTIELREFATFKIDGQTLTNELESYNGFSIKREGGSITLITDFGLKVSYDGRGPTGRHVSHVTISNPDFYGGKVCGICGNWNGDLVDDYWPFGQTNVATVDVVGESWNVANHEHA